MRQLFVRILDIIMLSFVVGILSGAMIIPLFFHSKIVNLLWSITCHQITERSFHISGSPILICARCVGIYIGYLMGRLFTGFSIEDFLYSIETDFSKRKHQLVYLLIAFVGVTEWYFSAKGVFPSNNWVRLITGLGMGIVFARIIHGYLLKILCYKFT